MGPGVVVCRGNQPAGREEQQAAILDRAVFIARRFASGRPQGAVVARTVERAGSVDARARYGKQEIVSVPVGVNASDVICACRRLAGYESVRGIALSVVGGNSPAGRAGIVYGFLTRNGAPKIRIGLAVPVAVG